jgi:hypothetical protein
VDGRWHPPSRAPFTQSPDHRDADIILKVYDLRRETVMRESRYALNRDFWPRTAEEVLDVLRADHRTATSPRTLRNTEWIATETETGRALMEVFRARVARVLAGK